MQALTQEPTQTLSDSKKKKYLDTLMCILRARRPARTNDDASYASNWMKGLLDSLSIPFNTDEFGNLSVDMRDGVSTVAFTCHTDTVESFWLAPKLRQLAPPTAEMDWAQTPRQLAYMQDDLYPDDETAYRVVLPDPSQDDCLGADDGAGMALMLAMIQEGVKGLYIFFADEESGRIGSEGMNRAQPEMLQGLTHMLSFDRRDADIVTSQMGMPCISDSLADALMERLSTDTVQYRLAAGSCTDSASFMQSVYECGNIGVGYRDEHSGYESLSLTIWGNLLEKCVQQATWEGLPHRETFAELPRWQSRFFEQSHGPRSVADLMHDIEDLTAHGILDYVQDYPEEVAAMLALCAEGRPECIIKDCTKGEENSGFSYKEIVDELKETQIPW